MHICVSKLTIIDSDNGLSPGQPPAIIWTNAGILLTEPLGTNFTEILIQIHAFSFPAGGNSSQGVLRSKKIIRKWGKLNQIW